MGQQFMELSEQHQTFIANQKIFFVATCCEGSRINLSPKGGDTLRVLSPNRAIWLNLTGSGNESAAHLLSDTRMTIMFCAFEGRPNILRLYGHAKMIHHNDPEWSDLYDHFEDNVGARQIFDLNIEMVQTSCGMSVPFFGYVDDRHELDNWAKKQGEEGIKAYWERKNQFSLDGIATQILGKNTSPVLNDEQ